MIYEFRPGRNQTRGFQKESEPNRVRTHHLGIIGVGVLIVQLCWPLAASAQSCPDGFPYYCSNCGGYCCDEAHPYCTDDCMCSSSSSGCPSDFPLYCANCGGYCCDEAHPYCTADCLCSADSTDGNTGSDCPSDYPIFCSNCDGYCCDAEHPYCTDTCMCSADPNSDNGGGGDGSCSADAPIFCSNCDGYCCDNAHPYCTDSCMCSSNPTDGPPGTTPADTEFVCYDFPVADRTEYRCASVETCCSTSECYYEADGYTFACNGTECASAAQELVNYCIDSNDSSGGWEDDSGDSSGCQTAPISQNEHFSLLTILLPGF